MKNIIERVNAGKIVLCNVGQMRQKYNRDVYSLCQEFVCERVPGLQYFIRNDAVNDDNYNAVRLYFIYDIEVNTLIGFYTLSSSCMIRKANDETKEEKFEKLVSKIVPCVEIHHFALNEKYLAWLDENGYNNKGIGHFIYKNYIRNTIIMTLENIAFFYVIVHAHKNDKVINAYRNMGFETYEDVQESLFPIFDELTPLRTEYEDTCEFMCQSIEDVVLYE